MNTFVNHNTKRVASFEARVFPPDSYFFRGGLPAALENYQFYTTQDFAMTYLALADERKQRPLSVRMTFVKQPVTLFVMSPKNLALLDDSTISSKLRRTMVETLGYNKASRTEYQRFAYSNRGPKAVVYKTQPKNKLQIHTHNYLNKSNKNSGDYAALSLAKQLKVRLQTLGFDGWIYPEDTTAKRPGRSANNINNPDFHPEVLVWSTNKISDTP